MSTPATAPRERFSDAFIAEVCARVSLVDIASAHVAWDKRKTRPARGDWWACCPFHDEKTPSFHVREPEGYFKCFGCDAKGDAITLTMHLERLSFPAAVRALASRAGSGDPTARRYVERAIADQATQIAEVRQLWGEGASAAPGGPVRTYLAGRGLSAATIALATRAGGAIREHRDRYGRPAMLAAARNGAGAGRAVQLTKLKRDGSAKRGDSEDRITTGPMSGAAVQLLAPVDGALAICEGVETALALYQLHRIPAWATLGAANLAAFAPPAGVRRLVIAADNDAPGRKAAARLLRRLRRSVKCTTMLAPRGMDWADVLAAPLTGGVRVESLR